jgi:ribose/xylose/arabinose/galactoside ABC-type transport system permease subunit
LAREVSFKGERRAGNIWTEIRERMGRSAEAGAIVGFVAVFLFFIIATAIETDAQGNTILVSPQILTARSISSFVTNAASYGILAVGVAILMIAGEFDLSVGSMLGLSALVFIIAADSGLGGLLDMLPFVNPDHIESWGISFQGFPPLLAIATALLTGATLGFINGTLQISTRIPSFIVTLGTLYIYRSIMYNIIPGGTIARYERDPMMVDFHPLVLIGLAVALLAVTAYLTFPNLRRNWSIVQRRSNGFTGALLLLVALILLNLLAVAVVVGVLSEVGGDYSTTISVAFFDILNGKLTFLPGNYLASIVWWFLIAALFHLVLTQTRFGNAVFATGGNPGAALAQGIRVRRIKLMAFMLSGVMAAIGGMMEVARFEVVEPLRGTGYELDVIAAVVIGGTLLTGGYGSIIGALLGVLISGMLKTGLVLIGVEATWFRGVLGLIMIAAVIINTNIRRQR